MIHRVATSERYRTSLIEIQRDWTICDLFDAVVVLERLAEAEFAVRSAE